MVTIPLCGELRSGSFLSEVVDVDASLFVFVSVAQFLESPLIWALNGPQHVNLVSLEPVII